MATIDVPLPDSVHVVTGPSGDPHTAAPAGTGRWTVPGAEATARHDPYGALRLTLAAPAPEGLSTVALRWRHHPGRHRPALVLGDAWERSYGESQWRGIQPEGPLPWYWLGTDPATGTSAGLGVRTRAGALCCWTVDEDGTTLWLDVRSGGLPALPGDREIAAATVVGVATGADTTPYAALQELCAAMSPDPLLPARPVVGCNNWYYAYGQDFGPDAVLRDAATIAEFAGDHPVRPFCVVDDGWTEGRGKRPGRAVGHRPARAVRRHGGPGRGHRRPWRPAGPVVPAAAVPGADGGDAHGHRRSRPDPPGPVAGRDAGDRRRRCRPLPLLGFRADQARLQHVRRLRPLPPGHTA
ncbi:hypothetical protein [Streptomyces sp. NPDC056669]|uniref:hypothetical protein n=1 Tax=Streptomyces sp. NPDC056669 TaxID=3345903 RepID=UPI0036B7CB08